MFETISVPDWHEIDTSGIVTQECGEELILLPANEKIIFEPKYYIKKIPGAIDNCYLRMGAYERLCKALDLLPSGYGFKIYDAWRPFEVQNFLYLQHVDELIGEGKSREEALALAKNFVSCPSKDPLKPFVHSTGGAIDLTIIDSYGNELDMGTGFDDFTSQSITFSFENSDNEKVKENRRLLYGVMIAAGFTNYPSEWWHFDFGDAFWASEKGKNTTEYGGIYKI